MHISLRQVEGRRFEAETAESSIIVDDIGEPGGPGDGVRPTELLLTGLAACMAGTMVNFANNQRIDIGELAMGVTDEVSESPSRIARISVEMTVSGEITDRQLESLRRVATGCKIHNTIASSVEVDFTLTRI